ncbi:three-helix bundle dimerization domain-containing protein [Streptomyces umbrinus]
MSPWLTRHTRLKAVHEVVARLTDDFSATRSPAEAAVAKGHTSFTNRPVREFVPVPVEHKARPPMSDSPSRRPAPSVHTNPPVERRRLGFRKQCGHLPLSKVAN